MIRDIFCILLLMFICCLTWAIRTRAQEGGSLVTGYSTIIVNLSTGAIRGSSQTLLDYNTSLYYWPRACGSLYTDDTFRQYHCNELRTAGATTVTAATNYLSGGDTAYLWSDHEIIMKYSQSNPTPPPILVYNDSLGYGLVERYAQPIPVSASFYPADLPGSPIEGGDTLYVGSTDVWAQGRRCADQRDNISQEYITYRVNFVPPCNVLRYMHNEQLSDHFSVDELNVDNEYDWGLWWRYLLDGMEDTRYINGDLALHVNSGYRNPARNCGHNLNCPSPAYARNSRHVYGDGVDIVTSSNWTQAAWRALRQSALAAGGCCEPLDQSTYSHVHADWRDHPQAFRQAPCPDTWTR